MAGLQGLIAKGVPARMPAYLLYMRIAILFLSVVILALAAYAISVFHGYIVGGYSGVSGLLIFVVIKTWIIYGISMFMQYRMPQHFYRIIVVALYTLSIIFWLSAWAWSASLASFWLNDLCSGDYCIGVGDFARHEGGALAACAGLGALVWILSIVHAILFALACIRDNQPSTGQSELGNLPPSGKEYATADTNQYFPPQQSAPAQYPPQQQYPSSGPGPYQQQPVYGNPQ